MLVGWWLSFVTITLITLLNLTIIGIPLALWLANRIPQVATLKLDRSYHVATLDSDGRVAVTVTRPSQRPFWQRALWYILVGWWLTTIALYVAWILSISILGLPLAFPIFSAAGKLLTLKRG